MSIFIHSTVSYSACGNSTLGPLQFVDHQYQDAKVTEGTSAPFFAMKGLALDQTEQRLYGTLFALIEELLKQSGLTKQEIANTALLLGSTSLDISVYKPVPSQKIWLPPSDNITNRIAEHFGLSPFHFTINTACTASLNALLYGKKLMQHMNYEHVIVVGCEFFNHLTLSGFYSLDLISSKGQLAAFSQERDGLILGEGIGALLLSKMAPKGLCLEVLEGYSSCDSFSLTTTQEDGSHIRLVIDKALEYSQLKASDIDLIKVHGTATFSNDLAESNALTQQFSKTPVLAFKPYVGHTLGACGVVELALLDALLKQNEPLPVPRYAKKLPEQLLMPFASTNETLADHQHILLNHCGFGGNNSALIVKVTHS